MKFSRVFSALLLLAAPLAAKHTPTFEESISLRTAGAARISPDGRFVAYTVSQADWKQNSYVSHLWLADTHTGRAFQLTRGKKNSGSAAWSPDGKWLAFITEREADANYDPAASAEAKKAGDDSSKSAAGADKETSSDADSGSKIAPRQIWLISPEGGEAWQLTRSETDVESFEWSKDGGRIAFLANPPESKLAKDRKERYAEFEVFEKDYEQRQIWAVDVSESLRRNAAVKAAELTHDRALNVQDVAWSPDGKRLAFSASATPLLAYSGEADIYLLDLQDHNKVSKLVALSGPDTHPVFSPDGRQIAFVTGLGGLNYFYLNRHIAVVEVEKALAQTVQGISAVNDATAKFDEDADLLDWGPDGIYFSALQKTASCVFRLQPGSNAIARVTPCDRAINGASFTRDFSALAFTAADSTHMTEVYTSSAAAFSPRKLTDMQAQVADWTLGSAEMVSWKSRDGTTIEGVLHKPADYDPAKKYPLLVIIHGGPTGVSRAVLQPSDRTYPYQRFLAAGAVILEPNYRGSAGYGQSFRSLNVRQLGVGDMDDVMSGVESLIAKGIADPDRLGAMGWSQGGYISAFLATHTDKFKAISVGAGISNWVTYYVSTDITPFTRQYLQSTPWDDPEIYARTSPMTTIRNAKTPVLIQQGSNDKRVPVPDSFELYRGLQDQKVPSRLILYTGFGHGINKPRSNRAVLQANYDWFLHYIWGQPIPKNSALLGSSEAEAIE
ncbi:MAG: S9 family peptidase [Acidobacteria bacterium]|nr:S9 family peptidase [Acidobacteriota bacterium]